MVSDDQLRGSWAAVLRRQPARIADGGEACPGSDEFEIICCDCGDDPGLDYSEVSPELQRLRGPYPIRAGFAAYVKHVEWHEQPAGATGGGRQSPMWAGRR